MLLTAFYAAKQRSCLSIGVGTPRLRPFYTQGGLTLTPQIRQVMDLSYLGWVTLLNLLVTVLRCRCLFVAGDAFSLCRFRVCRRSVRGGGLAFLRRVARRCRGGGGRRLRCRSGIHGGFLGIAGCVADGIAAIQISTAGVRAPLGREVYFCASLPE